MPTKLMVKPALVGVEVEDSWLSCASTVQTGGVFNTVSDVETLSAITTGTCVWKKVKKNKIRRAPLHTENIVIFSGFSALRPGAGFTSIYESNCKPAGLPECGKDNSSKTLFNIFATVKITY